MAKPIIAIIAPGEMGSGVGARLVERGIDVITSLAGRSGAEPGGTQRSVALEGLALARAFGGSGSDADRHCADAVVATQGSSSTSGAPCNPLCASVTPLYAEHARCASDCDALRQKRKWHSMVLRRVGPLADFSVQFLDGG